MSSDNDILVSVCMISFNHEAYIREAIEGVLIQKCSFQIELLIGEDCSTDKTREICQEYASKHSEISLLPSETNLGMIPNFMRTMQACTGKYIAFCEGDDYWTDPNKLQKEVDFLEANPDYGMVHTGYKKTKLSTGEIVSTYENYKIPQGDIYHDYLIGSFIGTATVLARKELIMEYQVLFNNLLPDWPMGDRPLWLYISSKSKLGFIDEYTAVYRRYNNSVTSFATVNEEIEFFRKSYEVRFYFVNQVRNVPDKIKKKMFRNYYSELLKYYYSVADHANSKEMFFELRNKYGFSLKDFSRYIGSRNSFYSCWVNCFIKILDFLRLLFNKVKNSRNT